MPVASPLTSPLCQEMRGGADRAPVLPVVRLALPQPFGEREGALQRGAHGVGEDLRHRCAAEPGAHREDRRRVAVLDLDARRADVELVEGEDARAGAQQAGPVGGADGHLLAVGDVLDADRDGPVRARDGGWR